MKMLAIRIANLPLFPPLYPQPIMITTTAYYLHR